MNCQDVTNLLDRRQGADLTPAQQESLGEHLFACESCESAWRASRMLRSFAETPPPSPRAGLLEETMDLVAAASRRPQRPPESFWLGGALGAALAASIAIVAVLGLYSPAAPERSDVSGGLTIALHETRDITLAIDSADSLADAQIRVTLSGGIALAGRAGQRDLRWTADIDAGINRLTIPVIAVGSEDAELLVEVEHGSKHRRFLVQVDVVSVDEEGLATG